MEASSANDGARTEKMGQGAGREGEADGQGHSKARMHVGVLGGWAGVLGLGHVYTRICPPL